MLLYGPPGVGKTTIASIIAAEAGYVFVELSATDSTVSDLKELLKVIKAENSSRSNKQELLKVVVFIDEIHRFSKIQQDFLLPFVEEGSFVFIGATTVSPKSRIRRAILSRSQLFELYPLTKSETEEVLHRAIRFENMQRRERGQPILSYDDKCIDLLLDKSGDTRMAVNLIEFISSMHADEKNESRIEATKSTHGADELESSNFQEGEINLKEEDLIESIKSIRVIGSGMADIKNQELFDQFFEALRTPLNSRWSLPAKFPTREHESPSIAELVESSSRSDGNKERVSEKSFTEFLKTSKFDTEDKEIEYLLQMQVSDDSDVEEWDEGCLSSEPATLNDLSLQDYKLVSSLFYLNKLLQAGESPTYIGKQLVLFAVSFVEADAMMLRKILSHLSVLLNTNMDVTIVLSQCVGWIVSQKMLTQPQWEHFNMCKEYFRSDSKHAGLSIANEIEIEYDSHTIDTLMRDPKEDTSTDVGPEYEIKFIDGSDQGFELGEGFDLEEEINLGTSLET
ncbi:P-loop containing nucleoside triphosphate hydrolase protein [Suhomyces tanzawaensis NRRL Y-17324]|uniref:p-loop containing nucleoside triphosphate hydrolase protein n=1 Tax=Suhomyces tanzawaensis NRRL Y-17324 TaxID=984487 RepID=A0A1E4SS68_9ASCO|nr:P-loop containing nucleoside triphosphate hydrolase protein [Suhomyces tanzawaensis NRRL Y-17324]ODV82242.1 P-loop containing nucleoside triphosphate hydrolase protein [Suhomyces tanzawaensis NRRL Y-17324]